MTLPTIEIVDKDGNLLPYLSDEPDVQYSRLFHGVWRVRLDRQWKGKVALFSSGPDSSPLLLTPVNKGLSDLWHFPREKELSNKLEKIYKISRGASGRLQIGLIDENGQPVPNAPIKHLEVFPGNISSEQLSQMIDEIGLLVISTESRVIGNNIISPVGEGQGLEAPGFHWDNKDELLTTAKSIQQLITILQREVPRLRVRPLSSIAVKVGPTRVNKALSRTSALQRLRVSPNRRTIVSQTRVESLDCSENRFVLFILYLLERQIPYIRTCLEESLPTPPFPNNGFGSTRTNQSQYFGNATSTWRRGQDERQQLSVERKRVAAELAEGLKWVIQERKNAFWFSVSRPKLASKYSLRLTGTPSYAAIYVQYHKLWGNTQTRPDLVYFLLENLQQGRIRPVWEIYEIWCFVKIYSGLILEIQGLLPVDGHLSQRLFIDKGELKIPKNTPFTLAGKLPDNSPLRFRLWYEPILLTRDGRDRAPDILIELSTKRAGEIYFIFDSKYRDYNMQSETELVNDVYGVAKIKYLESGLRFQGSKQELDIRASFILHTSQQIDYWGEIPMKQLVGEHFGTAAASHPFKINVSFKIELPGQNLESDDFAGHRYGAISLCVGNPKNPSHQFRRLIYLLLYYFAGEFGYCPHCGVNAESADDYDGDQGQGRYYSCPNCGRFWVEHFCCGNGHHRIVKLGEESFHRPTDHKGKWVYKCPECGAELPSRNQSDIDFDNSVAWR